MFNDKQLDLIIEKTVTAIEESKTEIFAIAEMARNEYERVSKQLAEIQEKALEVIDRVDEKEGSFRQARLRLMEVSRTFGQSAERSMADAYEEARLIQLELVVLKERETQLKLHRDELVRTLRNLLRTVERADRLTAHVGVAIEYLRSSLRDLEGQFQGMQLRQQLGIRVIKAQEEERRRVARDIHDGPAQSLASLVMQAEVCEKLLTADLEQAKAELQALKDQVRGALQDIRRIIYDLRPMTLDDLGLAPTLRRSISDFNERNAITTEFSLVGREQRLPMHIEVGIFRIIQEALNNVQQHSKARNVVVRLEFAPVTVSILIRDDGIGFEPDETFQRQDHFGILSMRERVELLGGTWQLASSKGAGTRILVRIPIEEVDEDGH